MDKSQQCMEQLQEAVETGRATKSMCNEMIEIEVMSFAENAPKYNRSLEKKFEWCKKLETISDYDVKRMLYFCITGSARKEIVTLYPTGLAFNYGTVEFFREMLIRVSPAFEEIRKRLLQEHHEYLDKRHREELRPEEPCRKEGY